MRGDYQNQVKKLAFGKKGERQKKAKRDALYSDQE